MPKRLSKSHIHALFVFLSVITLSGVTYARPGVIFWQFKTEILYAFLIVNIAIIVVSTLLIRRRLPKLSQLNVQSWLLLLLIVYALSSVFWTYLPPVRQAPYFVMLISATMFGAYLAISCPRRAFLLGIMAAAVAPLAVSLFISVQSGFIDVGGVYPNKNHLSRHACFTLVLLPFVFQYFREQQSGSVGHRAFWIVLLLAVTLYCLSLIGFYRTATAQIAIVFGACCAFGCFVLVRKPVIGFVMLGIGVAVAVLAAYNISFIAAFIGEVSTVSGKLSDWRILINQTVVSELSGAGFGSFWKWRVGAVNLLVAQGQTLNSYNHAHNGFIDVYLELGILGLLIVAAWLVTLLVYSLREIISTRGPNLNYNIIGWSMFSGVMFMYNVSESTFLPNSSVINVYWSILVYLTFRTIPIASKS